MWFGVNKSGPLAGRCSTPSTRTPQPVRATNRATASTSEPKARKIGPGGANDGTDRLGHTTATADDAAEVVGRHVQPQHHAAAALLRLHHDGVRLVDDRAGDVGEHGARRTALDAVAKVVVEIVGRVTGPPVYQLVMSLSKPPFTMTSVSGSLSYVDAPHVHGPALAPGTTRTVDPITSDMQKTHETSPLNLDPPERRETLQEESGFGLR